MWYRAAYLNMSNPWQHCPPGGSTLPVTLKFVEELIVELEVVLRLHFLFQVDHTPEFVEELLVTRLEVQMLSERRIT